MTRSFKQLCQFLLLLGGGLLLADLVSSGNHESAINQKLGGDFQLIDHNGQSFDSRELRGKLVLVFFGYTYCPDVCPTELSALANVLKELGDDADKVSALFISVDPERDTVEKLSQYVPFFSPDLIGLTGSEADISVVMDSFNVQRKLNRRGDDDANYLLDHSANLYVVGAAGQLIHIIPFGLPATHILSVLRAELDKLEMMQHENNT